MVDRHSKENPVAVGCSRHGRAIWSSCQYKFQILFRSLSVLHQSLTGASPEPHRRPDDAPWSAKRNPSSAFFRKCRASIPNSAMFSLKLPKIYVVICYFLNISSRRPSEMEILARKEWKSKRRRARSRKSNERSHSEIHRGLKQTTRNDKPREIHR